MVKMNRWISFIFDSTEAEGLDTIKRFLRDGADVNSRDCSGGTFLFRASTNGHTKVVRYLVEECKADVDLEDHNEYTPLHMASNIDITTCLVENGSNVNLRDNYGDIPLHLSGSKSNI